MIEIFIYGQRYEVPEGLTILKAYEWAGFQLKRGVGCRGGFLRRVRNGLPVRRRLPLALRPGLPDGCSRRYGPGIYSLLSSPEIGLPSGSAITGGRADRGSYIRRSHAALAVTPAPNPAHRRLDVLGYVSAALTKRHLRSWLTLPSIASCAVCAWLVARQSSFHRTWRFLGADCMESTWRLLRLTCASALPRSNKALSRWMWLS